MIRDKQLIQLFVRGYSDVRRKCFTIIDHPDEQERRFQAVDVLARAEDGNLLAVEHTLLEPFEGERRDAQPFMAVFSSLEADSSLILPQHDVTVSVPAFAVPVGVDWEEVAAAVNGWFRDNVARFPDGNSLQEVTGLPFVLRVGIEKTRLPDIPGYIFIARIMPVEGLRPVAERAVQRKLPKLLLTLAEQRILLVERRDASYGYAHIHTQIRQAIEAQGLNYPDEIWLATTISWDNSQSLWFHEMWPELRRAYFYVTLRDNNPIVELRAR